MCYFNNFSINKEIINQNFNLKPLKNQKKNTLKEKFKTK